MRLGGAWAERGGGSHLMRVDILANRGSFGAMKARKSTSGSEASCHTRTSGTHAILLHRSAIGWKKRRATSARSPLPRRQALFRTGTDVSDGEIEELPGSDPFSVYSARKRKHLN